jgi:hypothetical protein
MLNSGGKKFELRATKKINILTHVLSENIILNETKNHKPPHCKLNDRSITYLVSFNFYTAYIDGICGNS